MKTKTTSPSFRQAARLLLITCATLASALFSLGSAKAQDTTFFNNSYSGTGGVIINNGTITTAVLNPGSTSNQQSDAPRYFSISYIIPSDATFIAIGSQTIMATDFIVNSVSFATNSTLTVDGTLTTKNIFCDVPNATMVLCPNAVVDLGGSTLTVASIQLADGTAMINGTYSFNDGDNTLSPVPADQLDSIPSFTLSNGAKLIHGTLIIDSTQPNAVHLVESNEHSTPAPGTITMIPNQPSDVSSVSISSPSAATSSTLILNHQH